MLRLSIVIVHCGDVASLEDTLVSVLQNRPRSCEILLVHRGDYRDQYQLDGEVRFARVAPTATPLAMLNAGIVAARSEVVHLLAAGVEVTDGWTVPALSHFDDPLVGSVSPLVLDAHQPRIITAGAGYVSDGRRICLLAGQAYAADSPPRATVVGPTLLAGFYRKSALDAVNGFADELGIPLADIDTALAQQAVGFRSVFEPASRTHVSATVARNLLATANSHVSGLRAERLFWRHLPATGSWFAIASHVGMVIGETLRGLPLSLASFIGRARGSMEATAHRQYRKRIEEITPPPVRSFADYAQACSTSPPRRKAA